MTTRLHAALRDGVLELIRELAGTHLGGIDLLHEQVPVRDLLAQREPEFLSPVEPRGRPLVKQIDGGGLPALQGRGHTLHGDRGLAGAGRAHEERRGAPVQSAAQQAVQSRDASRVHVAPRVRVSGAAMNRGNTRRPPVSMTISCRPL